MPQPYLFINYRKKDAVVLADSLHLMLRDAFGDVVFLDSSELEKGAVFPPRIEEALNMATCLLVLIGERWLHQYDELTGIRRLDLPDDWVRMEIEWALKRSIDVIPVLAPGAEMPTSEALPESIRSLHVRVPVRLRAESYVEDRHALIEELAAKHGFQKRPRSRSLAAGESTETAIYREPFGRETPQEDTRRSRGPKAWLNGTVLHYSFFRGPSELAQAPHGSNAKWVAKEADMDVVRQAFEQWKSLGIGLDFQEVAAPEDAEVRIGFVPEEGSWSYVGRDADEIIPRGEPTMNFGWDLTAAGGLDTVLQKVGHALGLAREHQNPNSGIVWDDDAVYAAMEGPPNFWPHKRAYWEIIRKGDPAQYYGPWDPDSIMHFPFGEGLILEPAEYRGGLLPSPGLSAGDKDKVRFLYPPRSLQPALIPLEAAPLSMQPGEQANFTVVPRERRRHNIQTFGPDQVVMMLFEDRNGQLTTLAADDNTGQDRSAQIAAELDLDRRYVLRVRLFERRGDTALMLW